MKNRRPTKKIAQLASPIEPAQASLPEPLALHAHRSFCFAVGSTTYRAGFAPGPITLDGADVLACTIQINSEILIAPDAPDGRVPFYLLRELVRAWTFEVGTPADADGWLDLAATVSRCALRDLQRQGGVPALLNLRAPAAPQLKAA